MHRLRPVKALVHDAVDATTLLVGEGHESSARLVVGVASAFPGIKAPVEGVDSLRRLGTDGVLATVRWVNRAVEQLSDAALDLAPQPVAPKAAIPLTETALWTPAGAADQLVGVLNGVVGDHLHRRASGLDMGLRLRHDRSWLGLSPEELRRDLPQATGKLVVLVHGLATTETSWSFGAGAGLGDPEATYGSLLQQDLGYTPLFVQYNTGLPIAASGQRLAQALSQLVAGWPVPVEELVLVGHSMGGLVCRVATWQAHQAEDPWLGHLSHVVCVGAPHRGAPLARLGHVTAALFQGVDLPATRIIGRILHTRSAGVKDLRHDEHTATGELVPGVGYAFLAGTLLPDPDHPVAEVLGDMLVTVRSAEGPQAAQGAPQVHVRRFGGVAHHQLQANRAVYDEIRRVLAGEEPGPL